MEVTLNLCKLSIRLLKNAYKPLIRQYSKEKIVPLDETTVLGRIVLYMNNEYIKPNNSTKVSDELKVPSNYTVTSVIDKIKLNQPNHISNLNFEQIEDLLRTLKYENFMSNKRHFKRLMAVVDSECCSRLDYLDSTSILRILNLFTQSVPNRIREYRFYSEAIDRLMDDVDFLSKEELMQTIFYIGLEKKTKSAQSKLKMCLRKFSKDEIKSLTDEELCIICNSTFKTSTKITNKHILETIKQTLTNKLYLLKDTALFIILVKTLRHNRYQDEDLLNTITCTIFFNETYKYYPFPVLCHILAMYADFLFYDENLLKLFTDMALKELKESNIEEENIRPKDITRFLWVVSSLGYKNISEDAFETVIVPNILERIKLGQYKKETEELINSILYMWILNYQAKDLIPLALTAENVSNIRDIKSRTKMRLNLLLTCIFFENKDLFRQLNVKAQRHQYTTVENQLNQRPNLTKVFTALKQVTDKLAVNKFDLTFEIPHLSICGITGYTKKIYKTVYIEVLDEYVCIRNKRNMLTGPMQLKLRILREMDDALIVISSDLIERLSQSELEEYLKSEIEMLC